MPTTEQTIKVVTDLWQKRQEAVSNSDTISVHLVELAEDDIDHEGLEGILRKMARNGCFFVADDDIRELTSVHPNTTVVVIGADKIDRFKLYEYKQKLLGKWQKPIIKPVALETIARSMGELRMMSTTQWS